jgi:hypothetical protein
MEIVIKKKAEGGVSQTKSITPSSPYDKRSGVWGRVEAVHAGDLSADVFLDSGTHLKHVPVSSPEWVMPGKEYTSGERNLPPVESRVFIIMPTGDFDGCFILCSGFSMTDPAQKQAFMGDETEKIRKRVLPGNWKEEYQYATGTYELVSPDGKTRVKLDYGTEREAKDVPEVHLALFDQIKVDIVSDGNAKLTVFDWKAGVHTQEPASRGRFTAVNVTTLKLCFNIFGLGYGPRPV